jgi:hypothetical protein
MVGEKIGGKAPLEKEFGMTLDQELLAIARSKSDILQARRTGWWDE